MDLSFSAELVMRFYATVALACALVFSGCALYPVPEDVVIIKTAEIVEHIRCELREALKEDAYNKDEKASIDPRTGRPLDSKVDEAVQDARKDSVFTLIVDMREKMIKLLHNYAYSQSRNLRAVSTSDEFDKIIDLNVADAKINCELMGTHCKDKGKDKGKDKSSIKYNLEVLIDQLYDKSACIKNELKDFFSGNLLRPKAISFRYLDDARIKIINKVRCLRARHKYYQDSSVDWEEACEGQHSWTWRKCSSGIREPNFKKEAEGEDTKEQLENERKRQRTKLVEKALRDEFKAIAVGYGFNFQANDTHKAGIGLDFSLPFSTSSFGFGVKLNEDNIRATTRDFVLAEDVADLLLDVSTCEPRRANWRYPLAGTIGLSATVKAYASLSKIAGFFEKSEDGDGDGDGGKSKPKEGSKEFTETLEFTTEIGGNSLLSPTFSFNAVKSQFRLVKAAPTITRTRKDVHKLILTFTKGDEKSGDKQPKETPYRSAAVKKAVSVIKEKQSLFLLQRLLAEKLIEK